jgi:hypothetical protein
MLVAGFRRSLNILPSGRLGKGTALKRTASGPLACPAAGAVPLGVIPQGWPIRIWIRVKRVRAEPTTRILEVT